MVDGDAPTFRDHIQPFQLSIATEASREMSRDEADNVLPAFCDEDHPRRQGLLRMQLTSHVPADAVVPILLGAPHRCTKTSEPPDVSESTLPDHGFHQQNTSAMNLPLDFNSAEPWTRIVKIALTIAAVYVIAVVGLFVKGNFLGGAFLLVFGLAFYAVLRRARRVSMGAAGRLTASAVTVHPVRVWGFSLNVPSGEFPLNQFEAVGLLERIVIVP